MKHETHIVHWYCFHAHNLIVMVITKLNLHPVVFAMLSDKKLNLHPAVLAMLSDKKLNLHAVFDYIWLFPASTNIIL